MCSTVYVLNQTEFKVTENPNSSFLIYIYLVIIWIKKKSNILNH